jgi:hypothetical protein
MSTVVKESFVKLENVDSIEGFVQYMSSVSWGGNSFIAYTRTITKNTEKKTQYAQMNVEKVMEKAIQVGMRYEVIVYLAHKVFNQIYEKTPPFDRDVGRDVMVCYKSPRAITNANFLVSPRDAYAENLSGGRRRASTGELPGHNVAHFGT